MKLEEIPEFLRTQYEAICEKCKKVHRYRTQPDYAVTYYIPTFIKCDCGHYVKAQVPVR